MFRYLLLLAALICPAAHADETKVKSILQKNYPQIGNVENVYKAPYLGLYEVVIEGQLFYTDEKAQYLINGNIYDLKTRRNLTEERSRKLFAIEFDKLPLELAVKKVKGNGQRKMAYFTDPNCGWCKKLEHELQSVNDVTLYLFLSTYIGGNDSAEKAQAIWCSKDQGKAWDNLMLNGVQPAPGKCEAPTAQVMELGKKLRVNGTPALIFANGVINPGYMPAAELEKELNGAAGH
jgi:thiol:disulfide interchange protein DsbC